MKYPDCTHDSEMYYLDFITPSSISLMEYLLGKFRFRDSFVYNCPACHKQLLKKRVALFAALLGIAFFIHFVHSYSQTNESEKSMMLLIVYGLAISYGLHSLFSAFFAQGMFANSSRTIRRNTINQCEEHQSR